MPLWETKMPLPHAGEKGSQIRLLIRMVTIHSAEVCSHCTIINLKLNWLPTVFISKVRRDIRRLSVPSLTLSKPTFICSSASLTPAIDFVLISVWMFLFSLVSLTSEGDLIFLYRCEFSTNRKYDSAIIPGWEKLIHEIIWSKNLLHCLSPIRK